MLYIQTSRQNFSAMYNVIRALRGLDKEEEKGFFFLVDILFALSFFLFHWLLLTNNDPYIFESTCLNTHVKSYNEHTLDSALLTGHQKPPAA